MKRKRKYHISKNIGKERRKRRKEKQAKEKKRKKKEKAYEK